jgi:hypothetical protein
MSLKIKKLTGEIFDLPPDYVIETEKNNPLFTNKGSKTVPIHFPNTNNNRKLLLNSERLDRIERPDSAMSVVVESGSSQQSGLMVVNSGFNAGIGFDESEIYNRMSQMRLRDMPNLPSFTAGGGLLYQRVDAMMSHLTAVMKEQVIADYCVFPVLLSRENADGKNYDIILNELDLLFDQGNLPYGKLAELSALNNRTITRYIDGKEVLLDAPKGYGVSPFLKTYRILELVFEHFGFKVEENTFKEHRQLKKLVVLNNVMDACLTGTLFYRDMMPDITIKSFLDGLYNKFGMQYFLNSNSKTVRLKFLNDTLIPLKSGSINLNNYKTEEPQINYTSPKQLKLIANKEIELAKSFFNTFEEFLEAYNYQFTERYGDFVLPFGVTSVFDAFQSRYWITDADHEIHISSSDFFDWDKKDDLPYEEIKMDDLCVPLEMLPGGYFYLFYSVNYKHLYSDIVLADYANGLEANPAKLAFAFAWGLTKYTAPSRYNHFFASQINRDEYGNFIYDNQWNKYDISLTCNREDGLFNRFWRRYDAFLRHSNFEVKCKLRLSEMDIFNLDMFKTAIINNQPLLPKQIKYKLNQPDAVSECSFQTLRLYEPYNLEAEQKIPIYTPQKYYWDWTSVETPNPENYAPYVIISGKTNTGVWDDGVEILTKNISMMPPTEEEYQRQEKRIFVYEYEIRGIFFPFTPTEIRQTVTWVPKMIEY